MEEEPGDVLLIDELSDYLRISRSTLQEQSQDGRVPTGKVGRHWRFRNQAIDRWLERDGADGVNVEGMGA